MIANHRCEHCWRKGRLVDFRTDADRPGPCPTCHETPRRVNHGVIATMGDRYAETRKPTAEDAEKR